MRPVPEGADHRGVRRGRDDLHRLPDGAGADRGAQAHDDRHPQPDGPAAAAAAAPAEPAVRRPLLGSVGSGDLEVRERRARRAASEALAQSHPEEFALLLRDARAAEGLRPLEQRRAAAADGTLRRRTPRRPPTGTERVTAIVFVARR